MSDPSTEPASEHAAMQQRFPVSLSTEAIGDQRVLAALERLSDLERLPIHEHADVFVDVHRRLTDALGATSDS